MLLASIDVWTPVIVMMGTGSVRTDVDIVLRPTTTADLPALAVVVNRVHHATGTMIQVQPDELAEELQSSLTEMGRDSRLAVDRNGRIVGFVWTIHLPSDDADERCYVDGGVDPLLTGRGIGRMLAKWGIEHARELHDLRSGLQSQVIRVSHQAEDERSIELFASLGFTPVRWFDDLVRTLDLLPARRVVDGAVIEPWPLNDPLHDDIRRAKNDAFADHWGSTPTTPDGWVELVHGFGGRPDLSFVARDASDGRVVAMLLSHRFPADDALVGRTQAWIDTLGTVRGWRGRGLATALIVEAMHRYEADGMTHAMINVDADSPTGASRLYRSLGFDTVQRYVTTETVHRRACSGSM